MAILPRPDRRQGTGADPPDEPSRAQEGGRVDQQHGWCRDERDQGSGERRTGHLRHRHARIELAVGVSDLCSADQRRKDRGIGRIEEDTLHPGQQGYDDQQFDAEPVERRGCRDHQQRHCPPDICSDHDRASPQPIHPCAGDEADEQEGEPTGRGQQTHLEGRRIEREGGEKWNRHGRNLRTELGDCLGTPEIHEVAVGPKTGTLAAQRCRDQAVSSTCPLWGYRSSDPALARGTVPGSGCS